MTISRTAALLGTVVALSGCYHAIIETGLPPANADTRKALGIGLGGRPGTAADS